MENNQLIDIQTHCFRLRELLSELHRFAFLSATDWLNIASGIESVTVNTSKYDNDIIYCSSACDFEEKRSELLSLLTTRLTVFNFVWGSFESVTKIFLPEKQRKMVVDPTIRFLKKHYCSEPTLAFYRDQLYTLYKYLENHGIYKKYCTEFRLKNRDDLHGLGLHVVRKIRNELAHGSPEMPLPDDWGEKASNLLPPEHRHLELVDTCTRILLFTIQMLLLVRVRGLGMIVKCLFDEDGERIETTAHRALHEIHLDLEPTNLDSYLLLFK